MDTPSQPALHAGLRHLGPTQGSGLLWSWAEQRLLASRNYWVASRWPDGRPHAMPVWGVWHEAAFWFSSSRGSRKVRNLAADPRCVVTTENAVEPVVIEGTAEVVTDPGALARMLALENAKYRELRHRAAGPGRQRHHPGAAALGVRAGPGRLHRFAHPLGLQPRMSRATARHISNSLRRNRSAQTPAAAGHSIPSAGIATVGAE